MKHTAIVFIHGFTEHSNRFDRLIELLAGPERELIQVVLPGHQKTVRDFRRSGRAVWTAYVHELVGKLCRKYETVVLVGHSMGGLLSIDAAQTLPVKGIVAMALPLYEKITWRTFRNCSIYFGLSKSRDPEFDQELQHVRGINGVNWWNVWGLFPNTFELLGFMADTRKRLCTVTTPLTVINSEHDEIVSPRSARFVERHLPTAKVVRLHRALHLIYDEEELALTAQCVETLLMQVRQ